MLKIENFYLTPMPPKHLALAILLFAFIACSGDNTLTYGGQTYKTVKIGEQVWFAEDLNYEVEGSKCYGNDPDNCAKYGRLYDWETAMKICPEGWHLPTNEEWEKLFRFVDGDTTSKSPYESPTAGKHLKARNGWRPYSGIENLDTYGFSALPGGYGYSGGSFRHVGYDGYWWSASEYEYNIYNAYIRDMYYGNDGSAYWYNGSKSYLYSVRCLQD